jgi:hypothetical protein
MEIDSPISAPLPVIRIICDAFLFVWDKRVRMLRALAIPVALLFVVGHTFTFADDDPWKWAQMFVQTALYILFAITCHRLALIGDEGVPNYGLRTWTPREWRYLGWSVVIMMIWMLYFFVISSMIASKLISEVEAGTRVESVESFGPLVWLAGVPILYIFTRLSVLYPAIALDQQPTAQWVWRLTADNGWRLTIVVGLLPWVLYFLAGLLLRENATLVENIIVELIGFILLAVEVVALSFSYKHLAKSEV